MRAPRHPQSCTLTEAAMDDLADKLGMDPLEFRLKNLARGDFHTPIYEAELKMGAELIGWKEKRKPRGQTGTGPIRHGLGVALHQWGGGGTRDKKVSCTINADGSVELQDARPKTSAPAPGRSWRSSPPRFSGSSRPISSRISATRRFPPGQASGGSTTTPSMSPPAYDAVTKATRRAFQEDRRRPSRPRPPTCRSRTASSGSPASR